MGRILELCTTGTDEFLQALGGDPYGGSSSMGLRVPTLATPDKAHRYLFLLSTFSLAERQKATILGYRQFASLGVLLSPTRFVELEITSPNFRLPDGNISWHLQNLGPPNASGFPHFASTPKDLPSFKKGWCEASALLYSDYTIAAGNRIYTQLESYVPPNTGKPWGQPLESGHQVTFFDERTSWRTHGAWTSLHMELEGPTTCAFFASVMQSAGTYSTAAATPPGLPPEEQFLAKFSAESGEPIYWRVGGSLIVEM